MDSIKEWCNLFIIFIERVGFPVFVAVWVLIVHTSEMKKLTAAINTLTRAVNNDRYVDILKKKGGE